MKYTASLLCTVALSFYSVLAQVKVPPNFQVGVKWQIEIQNTLNDTKPLLPTDAVVWDLDLYHLARNPGVVTYLRRNNPNTVLICYFNAGLAQTSDCDYNTTWANSGLLGNVYDPTEPEFNNERWINIKNATARDYIKRRITLAQSVGCDGVDPDNIDGYLNDEDGANGTGWNLSADDYVSFVTELANYAHGLTTAQGNTLLIGQKNGNELVGQLSATLDFAVLEDCKKLNNHDAPPFCSDFQAYITQNKPVFSIEYPSTLGNTDTGACNSKGANSTQYADSCDMTKGNANFSEVLKIQGGVGELNGCTEYCDGAGLVVSATNANLDGSPCPAGSQQGDGTRGSGAALVRVSTMILIGCFGLAMDI